MTEKESAIAKLRKSREEKAKSYKTEHDVQRLHHLIGALVQLRDQTGAAALSGALARELTALNKKQLELDEKEHEEQEEEDSKARAADAKSEDKESPQPKSRDEEDEKSNRAPPAPRRS